jgi:glycosyltransferase involved in cell wall biosynthesis
MYDVVCFSHLRWDFVFQRPQHLLSRCARSHRTVFVEEPVFERGQNRLEISASKEGVEIWTPHIDESARERAIEVQREMLAVAFALERIEQPLLWYYTPMALEFTRTLPAGACVYDCMDELSAFKGAPAGLLEAENELLEKADIVFTGGRSLYEAKRRRHPNVHAFPSSVDRAHFARARQPQADPPDQAPIARPRLGFFGVIDERFDLELVRQCAALRPEFQWVFIGPVVKIDPESLPRAANIHYLGSKSYDELPSYLSGWDVALLPFARNEATRFISPTKTPEYLAAGKPVVSTSIRDVVSPYGEIGLARIADDPEGFVNACEEALREAAHERIACADAYLRHLSWDKTWSEMESLLDSFMIRDSGVVSTSPAQRPTLTAVAK